MPECQSPPIIRWPCLLPVQAGLARRADRDKGEAAVGLRPPGRISPAAAIAAPGSEHLGAPGRLPAPEVAASPDLSRLPHVRRLDGVNEHASTGSGDAVQQTAGLDCPARAEPGADVREQVPRPACGDGPAGVDGSYVEGAVPASPPRNLHLQPRLPAAAKAVAEGGAAGTPVAHTLPAGADAPRPGRQPLRAGGPGEASSDAAPPPPPADPPRAQPQPGARHHWVRGEGRPLRAAAAPTAGAPPAPPQRYQGVSSTAEPAAAHEEAAASPAEQARPGIAVDLPQACELPTSSSSPPAAPAAPSQAVAAHASAERAAERMPPHLADDSDVPAAVKSARSDGHRTQHSPPRRSSAAEGGLPSATLPGRPAALSAPQASGRDRAGGAAAATSASPSLPTPSQHRPLDPYQEQVGMSSMKEMRSQPQA